MSVSDRTPSKGGTSKKEIKFYKKSELAKLFNYLESLKSGQWSNEYFKALLRLLVASGLRIGEAMALSWSDINFQNQTVSVSKTTVRRFQIQDTPKAIKAIELLALTIRQFMY